MRYRFAFWRRLFPNRAPSFIGHVQALFSSESRGPQAVADEYVRAMWSWQTDVEDQHDAFLLHPGMGPMLYLAADGRVLSDGRGWDGEPLREATDYEAVGAILNGAEKTGIGALLELLPTRPADAHSCDACTGSGYQQLAEHPARILCPTCNGLGWTPPSPT